MDVIKELREALKPKGSAALVRLFLKNNAYFKAEFVTECIDCLSKKVLLVSADLDEFNALEKLAYEVLLDSAYIERQQK